MTQVSEIYRNLSDDEWAALLKRSLVEPVIDGVHFPQFPSVQIQNQFVGSANDASLREALAFYSLFKGYAAALGVPVARSRKMLDFGCGWGRYLRFFWRDVDPENLYGVDTDPEIIQTCRETGISANLSTIEPAGRLPFPDCTFSHIMAYSVFTHLPERVQLHWLNELKRVARPGCIFICTTEPRRFLDFIATIPDGSPSEWHAGLKRAAGNIATLRSEFDAGEFIFIPTGGGKYRDVSVYGDAVIPESYIRLHWGKYFSIRAYRDEPQHFWQAIVVAQRA